MSRTRIQRWVTGGMITVATMTGTLLDANCAAAWSIFRGTASTDIGAGLKTALGGVIDGLVAIADGQDSSSSSTSTSSSTKR